MTTSDLQKSFEPLIETIIGICQLQFRGLAPEAKDEAIANTVGLCWKYNLRLVDQGRHDDEHVFNSMVFWPTRHTRQGRMVQQRKGSKDALEYRNRGRVSFDDSFDLNGFVGERTPVPDGVAYRIDVQAFLNTLGAKSRTIAHDLAQGMTTKEVARLHGVTPGAISQFRTRFKKWYEEFQGE